MYISSVFEDGRAVIQGTWEHNVHRFQHGLGAGFKMDWMEGTRVELNSECVYARKGIVVDAVSYIPLPLDMGCSPILKFLFRVTWENNDHRFQHALGAGFKMDWMEGMCVRVESCMCIYT